MSNSEFEILKGKKLKLFLCLLKLARVDLKISSGNDLVRLQGEFEGRLKAAFPYYSFHEIHENFLLFKKVVMAQAHEGQNVTGKLDKLYDFYYRRKYSEELINISSPDLYHFVGKRYLVSILKNQFLYPSIVNMEEYQSIFGQYEGAFPTQKDTVLKNRKLSKAWNDSVRQIKGFIKNNSVQADMNRFFRSKSFLPAMSCFTELPERLLDLHSTHYGSYGIQFKKQEIVLGRKSVSGNWKGLNFIRPIYYCDNARCSLPWLLLSRLLDYDDWYGIDAKKLMTDLYLLKPVPQTLYNPENIYSALFEREWRYISFDSIFHFSRELVEKIIISKVDYESWLQGRKDAFLDEIIKLCKQKRYSIAYI